MLGASTGIELAPALALDSGIPSPTPSENCESILLVAPWRPPHWLEISPDYETQLSICCIFTAVVT